MKHKPGERANINAGWIYLALFAFIVWLRWGALSSPLLTMADLPHALGSPGIRTWENLPSLFSSSYLSVFWEGSYHPLYTFSTMVNYSLFGFDPLGFRIFKIIIIWVNAILLSRIGRKELGAWAWAAGFLYALNPCHSSNAMLDMKDQLVTLSCLLGLLVHRRSGARGYPMTYCLAAAACNGLALLSKETGAVFPALLLAMDISQGAVPREPSSRRRWMGCYLLFGGVALLYAIFRFKVMNASGGLGYAPAEQMASILARLKAHAGGLTGLNSELMGNWVFPIYALLAAYPTWSAAEGRKKLASGYLAWIVLGLIPISGLLPIRPLSEYLADGHAPLRYLTLSGVGYSWLLSLCLRESLGQNRKRWIFSLPFLPLCFWPLKGLRLAPPKPENAYSIHGCNREGDRIKGGQECLNSLTAVLVSLPFMQSRFPDAYEGYTAAVQSLLGRRAHAAKAYFGDMLRQPCRTAYVLRRLDSGDFEEVWHGAEADTAIQESRNLLRQGDATRALEMLQGAMRLAPGHAGAHLEKAIAYWQLGRWPAVLREYKTYRELARMPNLNGPWCKEEPLTRASEVLISSVMRYAESAWLPQTDSTKQRENALQCLQQVTNLDPLDAEKYLRLGAKASLAGPPQGTPSSGSMAAPPGADSDRKAWLRLARIVFANIIPDNKPTPACSNYEGVKGPPHPPGPEAPELPPQLPPRPLPKRHPADHWLDLAQAAVAAAKPRLAESYLERALELHPGEEESSRSALLYQQMKGYHRALRILDSLAQDRDSEKQARWLNDRGVLKALMGKDQEAAADLRAAIARDPDFLPAYLSLGGLWDSSGRRAEAMRTYRAALGRTAAGGHDEVRRRIRDEYERMRSAPARRRR